MTDLLTKTSRAVSAAEFYDPMADGYDHEFDVPHRRVYDDLAWEVVTSLLPKAPCTVIDAGCGTGRLSGRLVALGHDVIGIEPSPRMADIAARRWMADRFDLRRCRIEDADIPPRSARMVMAMGSVQFTDDPVTAIARMAQWVEPGGHLLVLCDSLVGLVQELIRAGDIRQAVERGRTRRARWVRNDLAVEHHLLDAPRLQAAFTSAGLTEVQVGGLLVAFTTMGRREWLAAHSRYEEALVALERDLASIPELADTGKQLLAVGRVPQQ